MASFDFIDVSARGYAFIWEERGYLARVAIPVLFVKIVCLLAVFVLDWQGQYARQGLVLMPGYILEAVFVIGLIRYALYREAIFIWGKVVPVPPTDQKYAPYQGQLSRKQCVQGGIVMYVLLKIIASGLLAAVQDNVPVPYEPPLTEAQEMPSVFDAMIILAFLSAVVWGFRLLFLYIPIVMGVLPGRFLQRISGMKSSAFMIATWLVCFLPLIVFFGIVLQLFSGVFVAGSAVDVLISSIFVGAVELIIISVQVIAMTYGFVAMLFGDKSGK